MAYLPESQLSKPVPASDAMLEGIRKQGYVFRPAGAKTEDHVIATPALDAERYPRAVLSITCAGALLSADEFVPRHAVQAVRTAEKIGRLFSLSGSVSASQDPEHARGGRSQ